MAASAAVSEESHEVLGAVEVVGLDGAAVRLGTLWAERPLLLVLLRHFGCPACSRAVTELAPRVAELAALGVGLACVGPGTAEDARAFLAAHGSSESAPLTLLADPQARAFAAAGMRRSAWATFGPSALLAQARMGAEGWRIRGLRGDSSWLGGALLVDRGGRPIMTWRSESIARTPRVGALMDAVLVHAAGRAEIVV